MEFNPNNNVVKLCLQGMDMEDKGKTEEANKVFLQAWNEATDDFERFIAAHYVARFVNSRKVTAYVGLEPREYSSGERKRMGRISKAGSRVLRLLLVEAGIKATWKDADLKKLYHRVLHRRDQARAKLAVARHLLIHAFIMLRYEIDYAEFKVRGAGMRSAARTTHSLTS